MLRIAPSMRQLFSLSAAALPCDLISSAALAPTAQMYLKYNAVLRGLQFEFARPAYDALCKGNRYATTLHSINSAIIKLSKLTEAGKVYRGVNGGVLPEGCRRKNSYGVRGGVEGGFMSTTLDRGTALFYAKGGADKSKGGPALVFETQMGMVDRGVRREGIGPTTATRLLLLLRRY